MRTSKKCHQCGLVNFPTDGLCQRCSAELDAVDLKAIAAASEPKISKSTVYVFLFAFLFLGLGLWGFLYRRGVDRELAEKAKFMERQNNYAGHNINTIPPAGTETPTPGPARLDQTKGYKEAMEKMNKDMQSYDDMRKAREQALKNIKVPPPLVRPDR
jgi:hypothetical protein